MQNPIDKEPRQGALSDDKVMQMEELLREAKEKSGASVPKEFMPTVQKGPFEDHHENPTAFYEPGHVVYKMVLPYDELVDKVNFDIVNS